MAGRFIIFLAAFFLIMKATPCSAICRGKPLNPVTDVCWQCIFPITLGGVEIGKVAGLLDPPQSKDKKPICVCPMPPPIFVRIGIPLTFWEPARIVETVKDPFCFPSLGTGLSGNVLLAGSGKGARSKAETSQHFQQAHWFIMPAWAMLELFVDFICLEASGFDLAYMTEIDPLWQDDLLAFIIQPESLLFANPYAQLACIADSVSSQIGLPLAPLFWCMGSWGSAYPLTGHISEEESLEANAGIAARMIYKLSRELLICDTGLWKCGCIPLPIWVKWNYRLQIAKPVRGLLCNPVGRSSLIWGALKDPPYSGENFLWIVFRWRNCCAW